MIHPTFPNFKAGDRVAIRVPQDRYRSTLRGPSHRENHLGSGDLLYVVHQNHFSTLVEEARTGARFTVETLDLDPWNR